ncbi:MAG: NAD(P)/FAD-dependent oxidoreductase [Acidobacteria bacterium]|nr:MAG: NAD(P)/FAD-dependent oxidoreductase [Acidobacteriota bacterium]
MSRRYDLVVVGGGPAGLAVAIEARAAGMTVCVLERRRPPVDKPCGEGLLPRAVAALLRCGVPADTLPGRRLAGIRFVDAGAGTATFAPFPGRCGRGVRRTVLHAALAARAGEAGAEIRWGVAARGLEEDGVRAATGELVRGAWVVGADGLHSRVRRWAGIGCNRRGRRFGVRRHFVREPWTDSVEVHWADTGEAYVTPVGEELVGVAILAGAGAGPPRLAAFPGLARRLEGARPADRWAGAGPFGVRVFRPHRGRCVLVGDAAGDTDPITGEGIGLALEQARELVRALCRGEPHRYARRRRRLLAGPSRAAAALVALHRHPSLRRRALRLLDRHPGLFARLLAWHLGRPAGGRPVPALLVS